MYVSNTSGDLSDYILTDQQTNIAYDPTGVYLRDYQRGRDTALCILPEAI